MPFTTREAVKRALRIPTTLTDHDAFIDELITGVHGIILADIGGGLSAAEPTAYTSYFDIERSGMAGLRLPKWPVTAITTVKTGTANGATGTTLVSTDYYVTETGTLRLQADGAVSPLRGSGSYWPVGRQNVYVAWTAGITQGSEDAQSLELAEKLTVCHQFNTMGSSGRGSERIGNYSYTAESGAGGAAAGSVYPAMADRIISRYRSVFAQDITVP